MSLSRPQSRNQFQVAIICALRLEADAVEAIFDEHWGDRGNTYDKAINDPNTYTPGRIRNINVVLVHMPNMGKCSAASVASSLSSSYQHIRLALVVGICGGVPLASSQRDIRLGDVIISDAVVQHDFGSQQPDQFIRKDEFDRPPSRSVAAFLEKPKGIRAGKILKDRIRDHLDSPRSKLGPEYADSPAVPDLLFRPDYMHRHQWPSHCYSCGYGQICEPARNATCEQLGCDLYQTIPRFNHRSRNPEVFFGKVASGDVLMRSAQRRDAIALKEGVIAFEMEAGGVWDVLPCLVIKGVSDYADSHKTACWQKYAAATAAACMKAALENWIVFDPGYQSHMATDYISPIDLPPHPTVPMYPDLLPTCATFMTHLPTHNTSHSQSRPKPPEPESYVCENCNRNFSKTDWIEHELERDNYCPIHNECFSYSWLKHVNMTNHVQCPLPGCPKPTTFFYSRDRWWKHVSNKHYWLFKESRMSSGGFDRRGRGLAGV